MGFLKGTATVQRFLVPAVEAFGDGHVEALRAWSFEKKAEFGVGERKAEAGFAAGEDHLDAGFSFAKLSRGEHLAFGFRVTRTKIPAKDIKAQTRVELEALVADGKPDIPRIRKEARENALAYLEERAKDGRWTDHAVVPVVWDRRGEVWYGASSHAHREAFAAVWGKAFGVEPVAVTPKSVAGDVSVPELGERPAWLAESEAWSEWGNRFALWLANRSFAGEDAIRVGTDDVVFMISRKMVLDCPRDRVSHRGRDTFAHDVPVRMPEVAEAIRLGKMPTSVGLELVAGEDHFKCVLDPHRWVVTGLSLPKAEDGTKAKREQDRLFAIRRFFEVLDGMFKEFLSSPAVEVADASQSDG